MITQKKSLAIFGIMASLLMLVIFFAVSQKPNSRLMKISYLSVGQGDATFVETPSGLKYLIDVSAGPQILEALSKELSFMEKRIDGVFLTHMDADHVAGLVPVLEYYDVGEIFISTQFDKESLYGVLEKYIDQSENPVVIRYVDGTNMITLDKKSGVMMDIIFPIPDYPFADRNDRSLVMNLIFGETKFLFSGDASTEIENYLVEQKSSALDADILQIGHHGSNTSSSEFFLKTVSPDYAIISAGEDNDFGHPHQEVVERIEELEIEIVETKDGNQVFVSDGGSIVQGN